MSRLAGQSGQQVMEFAVVVAAISMAAVAVQFYVRRSSYNSIEGLTTMVLGEPTVAVAGRPLPRTGCLDSSGDGLCDCMDSDRDGSCDGMNANSDALAVETGPAPGRTTVITESSAGSSTSAMVSWSVTTSAPAATASATSSGGRTFSGTPTGRAVPRGSGSSSAPSGPDAPSSSSVPDVPDVRDPTMFMP